MLQKQAQKRPRNWPEVTQGAVGEPWPHLREPGKEAESRAELGPYTCPPQRALGNVGGRVADES